MPVISIGKNYENVFKSICSLSRISYVEDGNEYLLLTKFVESADWEKKEIIAKNGDNRYVYHYNPHISDVEIDGEENENLNLKITSSGASWFNDLKGKSNSEKGNWQTLIDNVANEYHKKFAYVVYDQSSNPVNLAPAKINYYKDKINRLLLHLGSNLQCDISLAPTQSTIDIYGVNLRLQIEEEKPVLCRLFFSESRGKRVPLQGVDAKFLDEILANVPEAKKENAKTKNNSKNSENVNKVLRALEDLINPMTKHSFEQCMIYSTKNDEDIIDNLLDRNSMAGVNLRCKEVRVFSVMHILWQIPTFDLKYNGKVIYRATVGFGDGFSLECLSCGEKLIDNNTCVILDDNEEKSVTLNFDINDYGLSKKETALVKSQIFAKHNAIVECNDRLHCRNIRCRKIRCQSQCVESDGELICKSCPYPEIMQYTFNFENGLSVGKSPTYKMNYAADELVLTQNNVEKCRVCGRTVSYSREVFTNRSGKLKLCSICSNLYSAKKPSADSVKLYRKNRKMLPVFTRVLHLFSTKACYEDREIIIFKVGNKKYIFNKLFSGRNEIRDYKKMLKVSKIKL